MLVRMVMILGGGMVVASAAPQLVKAAFWGQVVVYFLLTLDGGNAVVGSLVEEPGSSRHSSKDSGEHISLSENGAKAV